MAAEQRIVGGGLLVVGIAVALILVYAFWDAGLTPEEAYARIKEGPWPTFLEAEEKSDYLAMKRQAAEIVAMLEEAGRTPVLKRVAADAATASGAGLRRLREMADKGELEKIAGGRYPFEGEWFVSNLHRELTELAAAVEELDSMAKPRRVARAAHEAVALARTGSLGKVEIGEVASRPERPAEIPVPANDAELFRVLGTDRDALAAALETPSQPAGKARTARLRWNKTVATGTLAEDLRELPVWIRSLERHGRTIRRSYMAVRDDPDAKKRADHHIGKAYRLLGAELTEPHAKAWDEAEDKLKNADEIAGVLEAETRVLEPYRLRIPSLAPLFKRTFET